MEIEISVQKDPVGHLLYKASKGFKLVVAHKLVVEELETLLGSYRCTARPVERWLEKLARRLKF